MRFNPMNYPLTFTHPDRVSGISAWIQHIPFAFTLVELVRPRVVVELGALRGDSYCAFCEGVSRLGLQARCVAVDTWQGDPHAGEYGPHVLAELRSYHDPRYGSFSTLLQAEFDEAAGRFHDGEIDLLHIDGFHSYEAVKHDYETWRPKLSDAGVVLFHDTVGRQPGFGVWKLWEELSTQFPNFNFEHGNGLGVLAVGPRQPPALVEFLESAAENPELIRRFYAAVGGRLGVTQNFVLLARFAHQQLDLIAQWKRQAGLQAGPQAGEPDVTQSNPVQASQLLTKEVLALAQDDLRVRAELSKALARLAQSQPAAPLPQEPTSR